MDHWNSTATKFGFKRMAELRSSLVALPCNAAVVCSAQRGRMNTAASLQHGARPNNKTLGVFLSVNCLS